MTRTEKLLAELIALPSVNPAFLPPRHPHAGEQRVADFLAATAARAGRRAASCCTGAARARPRLV